MKKKIYVIIVILILIMILFANISTVQATGDLGKAMSSVRDFTNNAKNSKSDIINYQNLYNVINFLYNIAMTIGIIIAVIVGIVLGIRIIFGSIDERADSKHLLVPYLVIVTMLAFGFTIWKIALGLIYNRI